MAIGGRIRYAATGMIAVVGVAGVTDLASGSSATGTAERQALVCHDTLIARLTPLTVDAEHAEYAVANERNAAGIGRILSDGGSVSILAPSGRILRTSREGVSEAVGEADVRATGVTMGLVRGDTAMIATSRMVVVVAPGSARAVALPLAVAKPVAPMVVMADGSIVFRTLEPPPSILGPLGEWSDSIHLGRVRWPQGTWEAGPSLRGRSRRRVVGRRGTSDLPVPLGARELFGSSSATMWYVDWHASALVALDSWEGSARSWALPRGVPSARMHARALQEVRMAQQHLQLAPMDDSTALAMVGAFAPQPLIDQLIEERAGRIWLREAIGDAEGARLWMRFDVADTSVRCIALPSGIQILDIRDSLLLARRQGESLAGLFSWRATDQAPTPSRRSN